LFELWYIPLPQWWKLALIFISFSYNIVGTEVLTTQSRNVSIFSQAGCMFGDEITWYKKSTYFHVHLEKQTAVKEV